MYKFLLLKRSGKLPFLRLDILAEKLFITLLSNVNKILINIEEVDKMKKILKSTIKLCVFLLFTSIPFISITQMVGLDTFLDSFENSDHYVCIDDKGDLFGSTTNDEKYVIIQKSSHPDFKVSENDYVVYVENDGYVACNKVYQITSLGTMKRYNMEAVKGKSSSIFDNQVVGKIVDIIDNNMWNLIAIKIWDTSIHNLNIRALLAD